MEIISDDNKIILRDFIESDIHDCARWYSLDTEWMSRDAPWETKVSSYEEEIRYWSDYYQRKPPEIRNRLEIVLNDEKGTHIGWVIYYHIDGNYRYTEGRGCCTVGIDIPGVNNRGAGYGYAALKTYIGYLQSYNMNPIYSQTWSGNVPMIGLARKLGFKECFCHKNKRKVDGRYYDALTFILFRK